MEQTNPKVQILIDEDMAETVNRLAYQQRVIDLINGCMGLKLELGLPDRIDGATKGE